MCRDYRLLDPAQAEGPVLLRHAVSIKNVWIPFGE